MKKYLFRAALLAVLGSTLAGCGGGGGGGGDAGAGAGSGGGAVASGTGLVPTAGALGATLHADATVLRPVRDQAVWRYQGTTSGLGRSVSYSTATRQSVASSGAITETASNSANEGSDTQVVSVSGGVISSAFTADFAGKGVSETLQNIELRSPVREGDQYVILDKRYTDTNIDSDRDGQPDALDVAIYARVIGNEAVTLSGLPTLTALRVDLMIATRVTPSRSGVPTDVVRVRNQTWYAPGIGIVRTRAESSLANANGFDTVDEVLSSWDGISTGFGSLPTRVPTAQELGNVSISRSGLRIFTFPSHVLLVSQTFSFQPVATRYDLRGQVLGSVSTPTTGLLVSGLTARLGDTIVSIQDEASGVLRPALFNSDGTLQAVSDTLPINLNGSRSVPIIGRVIMAGDGDRFWLLWNRGYRENSPTFPLRGETILRPFDKRGQPLADEIVIDTVTTGNLTLTARGSKAFLTTSGLTAGTDLVVQFFDGATSTVTRQVAYANLQGGSTFVTPFLTDGGAVMLWGTPLGTGGVQAFMAGLRFDSAYNPVRSGSEPATELVTGLPAYGDSTPALAGAAGSRLVVATAGGGPGDPAPGSGLAFSRVSWLDTPATGPLNAASVSTVRFELPVNLRLPLAQAVYPDRALVFGDGGSVTVVWLNNGRNP